MKHIKKLSVLFVLIFASSICFAATSPVPTLENTANSIIKELQKNKANLSNNPKISYQIVTKYMLPMVDQQTMAMKVLGRAAWQRANASDKQAFIQQFRILVVKTYASAIAKFTNERVRFLPIRGGVGNKKVVGVSSQIIRPGRPAINVNYLMSQEGSQWKIIDFSVDGISMVESFHAQFAPVLSQSGVNGLVKQLKSHNRRS